MRVKNISGARLSLNIQGRKGLLIMEAGESANLPSEQAQFLKENYSLSGYVQFGANPPAPKEPEPVAVEEPKPEPVEPPKKSKKRK